MDLQDELRLLDGLSEKLCKTVPELAGNNKEYLEHFGYQLNWQGYVTALNLRDCQLSQIPAEVFCFKKLEYLVLSHNQLTSGETVKDLAKSLKYLDMSFNKIENIDNKSFATFAALEYLDLSHNPFTSLPPSVLALPLKDLHLDDKFVNELSKLKLLCQDVKQDLTVFIGENQFTRLSSDFIQGSQNVVTVSDRSSGSEIEHPDAVVTIIEENRSEAYKLLAAKIDRLELELGNILILLEKMASQGKTWMDVLKFEPNFFGVGVDVVTMVELLRNKKGNDGLSRTRN